MQESVPRGRIGDVPIHHQDAADPQPGRCRRGHAAVIGLGSTGGDEVGDTAEAGRSQLIFELAYLVPTQPEPGLLVELGENLGRLGTQGSP